jgi:putative flippase GtrA
VGALATAVDLALLYLLVDCFGVAPALGNVPALAAGLAVQFVGNRFFAFGDRATPARRQIVAFLAVECLTFACNAASFHVLAVRFGVHFAVARLLGEALVYFGVSLPCWARIFAARPGSAGLGPGVR